MPYEDLDLVEQMVARMRGPHVMLQMALELMVSSAAPTTSLQQEALDNARRVLRTIEIESKPVK